MKNHNNKTFKFPKGFLWGASTASHQVEGNNTNDWSEWEKSKKRIDDLISKGLVEKYGLDNYISGSACDHYNLFEADFKMAKQLNQNATRISIEWSRIEPEEGKFSDSELAHYTQVLDTISNNGMESFVTIWHWPLPLWLKQKGGWKNPETPKYFERYTQKLVETLGSKVRFWITLNEPEIYTGNSYLAGHWPPQEKNIFSYISVFHNLISAHKKAFVVIKKSIPTAKVGIAKNNIYFEAHKNRVWNRVIKFFIDWWWNYYFLDRINSYRDFIGLNHYFHNKIDGWFNKNENKYTSDFGWEIYPEAIFHCLIDLKKYKKPIYITENGLADAKDQKRAWFIKESLINVHKAITAGADVRGYLHWSLMDNFEWDSGFWPRFGLIEIDYKTKSRKIRNSAKYYSEICKTNEVDLNTYKKYSN